MRNVVVYPEAKNPTHEISLSDGVQTWGLRLIGGPRGIEEKPYGASILNLSNLKLGGDPSLSQIEQRDWTGGRGVEDFEDNEAGFFESQNVWTTTPGRIFPTLQSSYAEGVQEQYSHLGTKMGWQALIGASLHISQPFLIGASNFQIKHGFLWIRRKGFPAPLILEIFTDSGNLPDSALVGSKVTVSASQLTDVISEWVSFDLSAVATLTASTSYHLKISGNAADNAANHWEIGVDPVAQLANISTDGATWQAGSFAMVHRLLSTEINRKWQFFNFQEGLYAYDQRNDGLASSLLINGDRGKVTATTSTTLSDADSGVSGTWTVDKWKGAWVKIVSGVGKGQTRKIKSNTATQLSIEYDWHQTPTTSSGYLIYATNIWQDISPSSGALIDGQVEQVLVVNDQVMMSQGTSTPILKMRWNEGATPPAHEFVDDTNFANRLMISVDEINGVHILRANNSNVQISRAPIPGWGSNLVFATGLSVGDTREEIEELVEYHNQIFALKRDGLYAIHADQTISRHLGKSVLSQGMNQVRFVEAHQDGLLIHEGGNQISKLSGAGSAPKVEILRPFGGIGLGANLRGEISAILAVPNGMLFAIDAGENGFSSLLFQDDENKSWHQVYRSRSVGKRIQKIFWQDCPQSNPRLWISEGGELVCQPWPTLSINPLEEEAINYHHEGVITLSTITMGAVRFPKFLKQLSLLSKNLETGNQIGLDAQFDDEIGSQYWRTLGTFYSSGEDTLGINQGNVKKVRLRLRLQTNQANQPPIVYATILEGFVRTPLKYQWDLKIKVSDTQRDLSGIGEDHSPDLFLNWIKQAAVQAQKITVRSVWKQLDNKVVIVEPPSVYRQFSNNVLGFWGGHMQLSLREV